MDNQKKAIAIRETKKLEETSHNRQMNRLVRMKEIRKKIELQTINEEDEKLKQFSEALIKLGNEIKSTIILIQYVCVTNKHLPVDGVWVWING